MKEQKHTTFIQLKISDIGFKNKDILQIEFKMKGNEILDYKIKCFSRADSFLESVFAKRFDIIKKENKTKYSYFSTIQEILSKYETLELKKYIYNGKQNYEKFYYITKKGEL